LSVSREEPSISGDLFLVVASWFWRRSGSRVSILIACRRTVPVALSLCVNPMPSRITRKSTRPRVADRTMVDTRTTTSACQFQKPIGVVATNEHAAAEVERSKTRNHRARHKTRASLLSDKGLDAANHNPRFRRREKNVLDIPSYRTGDYTRRWDWRRAEENRDVLRARRRQPRRSDWRLDFHQHLIPARYDSISGLSKRQF